ncbi:MAG: hypothetical protein NZM37_10250 [Sandaracinaceae bacterium]|nr:hypothetical protein [Sandaracinaceae bacterium]
MKRERLMRNPNWLAWMVGGWLLLASKLCPGLAHAQGMAPAGAHLHSIRAMPKGAIGLAFIGAEIGLILPALAKAKDVWPYIVFPILGAGAGAVGGYFMDDALGTQAEGSVAILAVGMALFVPTVLGTLALTAYSPPEGSGESDETMQYKRSPQESVEATEEGQSSGQPTTTTAPGDQQSSGLNRLLLTPPSEPSSVSGVGGGLARTNFVEFAFGQGGGSPSLWETATREVMRRTMLLRLPSIRF